MKTNREDRIERQINNLSEKIEREFEYLKRRIDNDNTYFEGMFEIRTDHLLSEIQRVQK